MLLDALACIYMCYLENIDVDLIIENINNFKGAKRRFSETKIGNNIIVDDYFYVGDYIKYKGQEGKVVGFGLKTTKVLLNDSNNILSISNRNISEIEKVSNFIFVSIPVSYDVSIAKFETIVPQIVDALTHLENVENVPDYKLSVSKATLRAIKLVLDENKIEIPYPQLDVHNK